MATAPIMGCRTILTEQDFNLPHGLAALREARCPSAVCFTTRRTQSSSRPGDIYIMYLARLNPNSTHRICNTIKTTIDYLFEVQDYTQTSALLSKQPSTASIMHLSPVLAVAFVGLSTTVYCTPIQVASKSAIFPRGQTHSYDNCNSEQQSAIHVALREVATLAGAGYDLLVNGDSWKKNKG
jgi:hypothetical protein